jgi:uncharacterized protein
MSSPFPVRTRFSQADLRACAVALALAAFAAGAAAQTPAPAFDCGKAVPNSVEERICGDAALSELDARMAKVYAQAAAAVNRSTPSPRTSQRDWLKTRGACMRAGSPEPSTCIAMRYRMRIAELRARYGLVAQSGEARLGCGRPATHVTIRFYPGEDYDVGIAARGPQIATLYREPSGSGIRYADADGTRIYEEHQGRAWLTWGRGAKRQDCNMLN